MIDLPLMHALLRAMRRGSHLVLVGDADQLPSVGCGNVLADMIASGMFPVVKLDEIFRQSEQSRIVTNAHLINAGEMPYLEDKTGDFFYLSRGDDIATVSTVLSLVQDRLPRAYGASILHRLQIITPTRKGRAGTESLNVALQAALNPFAKGKGEYKYGGVVFRMGDRVMQIRNHYDLAWERGGKPGHGVFNGDIGVIQAVDLEEHTLSVLFDDDRLASYEFSMLDELEHAYAITVHKSQGSEYPVVLMPLCASGPMLQTRNLLYTALTRAKEMVILVGRESIIRDMVNNNRQVQRYTTLKDRLMIP
jgi:exodeoxyribonuclease V alpha subunit